MADYVDLLIASNDIALTGNHEILIDNRASIAQDIKHMIRDSGLLVEIIGQRNREAVEQNLKRIERKVEDDLRIVPGTARVNRTNVDTVFYVTAKTEKYGNLEVSL